MQSRNFEVVLITSAALTDEESQKAVDKHKKLITKSGGKVVHEGLWGRRNLAYEVKKQRNGIYHMLYIEADGNVIEEMKRQFGYDDIIIKYFVLCVENLQTAFDNFEALKAEPKKNAILITESIGA